MKTQQQPVLIVAVGSAVLLAFFVLGVVVGPGLPWPPNDAKTIADFHKLFYYSAATTWKNSRWLGVPLQKFPTDLMVYQEILWDTKPDVLVETGTYKGGSALYFASIMDLLQKGRVITIDVTDRGRPPHSRITYPQGFSTAPEIVATVKGQIAPGETAMVVLDSDHSYANVLKELQVYSPLVTKDAYLVVEDTSLNGHPVHAEVGPGPWEALEDFLKSDSSLVRDRTREKYMLTSYPGGFLRKIR